MAQIQSKGKKLIQTLTILTIITAALCLTEHADACNNVTTCGDIKLYDENGKTELNTIQFPLFTAGKQDTQHKTFTVRNTGKQPVHVSWAITKSSIMWQQTTRPNQPGYTHSQSGTQKYTLKLSQDTHGQNKYLKPAQDAIQLNKGETTRLTLELTYTGKPITPGTFTLTLTLTATTTKR